MNLIVCDEKCRHQSEGYCTLSRISSLTGDTRAKCGYFESFPETGKTDDDALPKDAEGL